MRVTVDARARPTFLRIDDAQGRNLYAGTLSGVRTFVGRQVRLDVGLATTVVAVDGRRVALPGSPAGLDIVVGKMRPLPPGKRPCGGDSA